MNESLAIISGKGGSGKTTLAISLAQLLAVCDKRVLLIDCDLSTHGATYFFESLLSEKYKYHTFSEILYGKSNTKSIQTSKEILQVAPNIGFIPSCIDFPSKLINREIMNEFNFETLSCLVDRFQYDIVICDCQAGYSDATDAVTRLTKKNLAVIEADAISASSLRVLYSQLSNQLDNGQTYQVFNKITKEEQDVYSKLTHGTLFTNLTPILFDWSVRKAFITNDLPNIGTSSPSLTNSIYDLAIVLFPSYKEDLQKFIISVKEKMLSTLEEKRTEINFARKNTLISLMMYKVLPLTSALLPMILLITYFTLNRSGSFFSDSSFSEKILIVTLALTSTISATTEILRGRQKDNDTREKRFVLQKEQERLEGEINQLKKKI